MFPIGFRQKRIAEIDRLLPPIDTSPVASEYHIASREKLHPVASHSRTTFSWRPVDRRRNLRSI